MNNKETINPTPDMRLTPDEVKALHAFLAERHASEIGMPVWTIFLKAEKYVQQHFKEVKG